MSKTIDSLAAADANARTHAEAYDEACLTRTRLDGIEHAAQETCDRARVLATAAQAEHTTAAENALAAENAWQNEQTPARWSTVEAARSQRDQAELRARAMRLALENAVADLDAARTRATVARASVDAAARAKATADDVLLAWQRNQRARDAEDAAREGARLRELDAIAAERARFHEELLREGAPVLVRALRHAQGLTDAVRELDAVLTTFRERGQTLRGRMIGAGMITSTQARPADVTTESPASFLVGVGLGRVLAPTMKKAREYPVANLIDKGHLKGVEDDLLTEARQLFEAETTPTAEPPAPVPAAEDPPSPAPEGLVARLVRVVRPSWDRPPSAA